MGTVMKGRCLVVCAAPVTPAVLPQCGSLADTLIIAADGGYLRCNQMGLTPDLILGDFDSAPRPDTTAKTLVFPVQKDDTDCLLAVKEGLRQGCRSFTLLGCTGGRLDHTFSAIQVLAYLTKAGATGRIVDESHLLTVVQGPGTVTIPGGGHYLSVFALDSRCTGVTLRGVAYPLEGATLENSFPLGTSNQITAAAAAIEVATGLLLVITAE